MDRCLEFVVGEGSAELAESGHVDLKAFFEVIDKDPVDVVATDVFEFLPHDTRQQSGSVRSRTTPLVRVPRALPRILASAEVDALMGALRTDRDRTLVAAMLLGALRWFDSYRH